MFCISQQLDQPCKPCTLMLGSGSLNPDDPIIRSGSDSSDTKIDLICGLYSCIYQQDIHITTVSGLSDLFVNTNQKLISSIFLIHLPLSQCKYIFLVLRNSNIEHWILCFYTPEKIQIIKLETTIMLDRNSNIPN